MIARRKELSKDKLSWQKNKFPIKIPPQIPLPYQHLPESKFEDYNLNGERNIYKALKQLGGTHIKEEEKVKIEREEPRYFSKILDQQQKAIRNLSRLENPKLPPLQKKLTFLNLFQKMGLKNFSKDEKVGISDNYAKELKPKGLADINSIIKKKLQNQEIVVPAHKRIKAIVIAINKFMILLGLVRSFKQNASIVHKKDANTVFSVNLVCIKT